jgi:5-formyltetrahydrofolate cyclo-ligase
MSVFAQKKLIRQKFKKIRNNLEPEYITNSLPLIIENSIKFLEKLKHSLVIGAYWPLNNELNVAPLLQHLANKNITCALPVLAKDSAALEFKTWIPHTKLVINDRYHISEPIGTVYTIPNVIIAPLIACDIEGNRIGYGKGFYDKYLIKQRKTKKLLHVIALCYEKQLSQVLLPYEEHDQKLDVIITEKKVLVL